MTTKIWCDGSKETDCYVIDGQEPVIAAIKPDLPKPTHNENEYHAIIHAVQAAWRQGLKDIEIISDSQLAIRQLNKEYEVKEQRLEELRRIVYAIASELKHVTYTWVPREQNQAGWVFDRRRKKRGKS